MRSPTPKSPDDLAPDFLIQAIRNRYRSFQDRSLDTPRPCPECGELDYQKHDTRDRIDAKLITEDGYEAVAVNYQRYWCTNCEKPVTADRSELFYDGCSYDRPIVNLCLYIAAENPFIRVERILHHLGIQVDRDAVQNYTEQFGEELADQHGLHIADCPVSINFLSFLFGTESVEEFRDDDEAELDDEAIEGIVGVADETYPAKKGAKKELRERNMRRKQSGETAKSFPEGFTLGASYLWPPGCFASLQCRETGFA